MTSKDDWTRCVVTVGPGRGFLMRSGHYPVIVTAMHCLPEMPPATSLSYLDERTYEGLVGPVDEAPTHTAEILFVDPVADIAVLAEPDNQALPEDNERFYEWLAGVADDGADFPALPMGEIETTTPYDRRDGNIRSASAWLLSLDLKWFRCRVIAPGRSIAIDEQEQPIRGGMSGSPIVDDTGRAIGLVSNGTYIHSGGEVVEGASHGNPRLTDCLPGWLLRELSRSD